MKKLVYIASPYTKGDNCVNTNCSMKMFDEMLNDGVVTPYTPLLSHFQHTFNPRPYTDWIKYDLEMLDHVDAVLRIDCANEGLQYFVNESSGADGEIKYAKEWGIPVFYDKDKLYQWAKNV